MKNHIKNYIKIMGLVAVPFGTAQAEDYEIRVTQEHKTDAEYFKISVIDDSKELYVAEIVWLHDKEYPNPIFEPNGFIRCHPIHIKGLPELSRYGEKGCPVVRSCREGGNGVANFIDWMRYYGKNYCGNLISLQKNIDKWRDAARSCGLTDKDVLRMVKENSALFDIDGSEWMIRKPSVKVRELDGCCYFQFPKGCFHVCYSVGFLEKRSSDPDYKNRSLYLVLVKDPQYLMNKSSQYMLGVIPLKSLDRYMSYPKDYCLLVSSDIPVVYAREFGGPVFKAYCSTYEIGGVARKMFCESCRSVNGYSFLRDELVCSVPYSRLFIRIKCHANDLPFNADGGYLDVVEISGGRVIDAWVSKQHMNAEFCSRITGKNAFQNPWEAILHVQKFFEKVNRKRALRSMRREDNLYEKRSSENFRESSRVKIFNFVQHEISATYSHRNINVF